MTTFKTSNGQTIEGHIEFLTETLIPDLRLSGSDATADDFEDCVEIIRHLQDKQANETPDSIFWKGDIK